MAGAARLDGQLRTGSRSANVDRVRQMSVSLLDALAEVAGSRILIRTGLQHAARGTNFIGYRDVGGLLEASPVVRGTLHVAVAPIAGTLDAWSPGTSDREATIAFDGVAASARYFDLAPFVAAASPDGWTVFDLRQLRSGGPMASEVQELTSRFDFLVLLPRASPATYFVEPTR
jgi:hypothetical protein